MQDQMVAGAEALVDVVDRFRSWRRTHPKRSRLPGELWTEAAHLARSYGIWRVAQALNLDYCVLKRHVAALPPAFVEVEVANSPVNAAVCNLVEMERGDGARMKVQCASTADLMALSEAFWRCRA